MTTTEALASDLYLQLTKTTRQILSLAKFSPQEVLAAIDAKELSTSRESIANAGAFLRDLVAEIDRREEKHDGT